MCVAGSRLQSLRSPIQIPTSALWLLFAVLPQFLLPFVLFAGAFGVRAAVAWRGRQELSTEKAKREEQIQCPTHPPGWKIMACCRRPCRRVGIRNVARLPRSCQAGFSPARSRTSAISPLDKYTWYLGLFLFLLKVVWSVPLIFLGGGKGRASSRNGV